LTRRQVIVAFFASALLTWISTCALLILEPKSNARRANVFDDYWTHRICAPIRSRIKNADVLAECFFRMTFALSDQQLVTGIAMMTAGLKMFAQDTISVYHFSIVRELAFFSSNSHLLSLLALWSTFSSDRKLYKKTGAKRRVPLSFTTKWRFFCIFAFFVLLLAGQWVTAFKDWDNMYECPAACVPSGVKELGGQPLGWAIATTYFLVAGYSQWTMQLGEKLLDREKVIRRRARVFASNTDRVLSRRLEHYPKTLGLIRSTRKAALIWRFWTFSDVTELVTMLAWFIANTYWTWQDKSAGYGLMSQKEWTRENVMGFGQIVPLVLLMLPLMVFLETYHGKSTLQNCTPELKLTWTENMDEQEDETNDFRHKG
jgi:hypothetical protein